MTNYIKSTVFLAAALLAAVVVGLMSFTLANQTRAPGRALQFAIFPTGLSKAALARSSYSARLSKDPQASPTALELKLAEEGFAKEPLASAAFPVLFRVLAANGNSDRASRFLNLSSQVTRRENLVNVMLIDQALAEDHPRRAIMLLGRAMAVSYQMRSFYMDRMAAATNSPGALEALTPLLGNMPGWSKDYWRAVLQVPAVAPQAGALRLRIAGPPWNLREASDTDQALILQLERAKHFDLAYDLARSLGLKASPAGTILRNSDFSHAPQFMPFDWKLRQTGEIGAALEQGDKGLFISSLPAANGVTADQLVLVPQPGPYRLNWKTSTITAVSGAVLKFRLTCAESGKGGAPIAPVTLSEGGGSETVIVPPSDCRWYRAGIELDTTQSDAGVDIRLNSLTLSLGGRHSDARPQAAGQR